MSERLNDYFAREAAEYLDELDGLLQGPEVPDTDALLRLATGVRGSAQMVQADSVALVAQQLEDATRSLLSGERAWTDAFRSSALQMVRELRGRVSGLARGAPAGAASDKISVGDVVEEGRTVASPLRTVPVSIRTLFFDDAGPHIVNPEPPSSGSTPHDRPVPIEDLLLRGNNALREALALRPALESFARGDAVDRRVLDEVIVELFDLVEQGMGADSPAA